MTTHPNAELWALQNVRRAGYTAYLPMRDEIRADPVTRSMKRIVSSVMWPGYLFVRFDRSTTEWAPLLEEPGVRGVLGVSHERPSPLPDGLVERLMESEDERQLEPSATRRALLPPGSMVQITDGPFSSFSGVCLFSTEDYAKINVEIFGRMTEVTLDRKFLDE